MAYTCEECGVSFLKVSQLLQHRRTENHWKQYSCDVCAKVFHRKDNLDRHAMKHNQDTSYHCDQCNKLFSRPDSLLRHKSEKHQIGGGQKRPRESTDDTGPPKRLKNDDDPRRYYDVTKIKQQRMEKFRTTSTTYKINFKDTEITEDVVSGLRRMVTALIEDLTTDAKSTDLIRLVVQSPSLDYPSVIPFGPMATLTADRFMAEIERVLQSNEDFAIDESLIFEVTHVDMPNGGSKKRCKYVNNNKFLEQKRCIIRVQNDDDLCCARAIVTAKAKLDNDDQWNSIRLGRDIQRQKALMLHQQSGVEVGKCGPEEVKKFQQVLTEYQIHVISREHFNGIIYSGPEADKKIYLYYHDNHYDVITSMSAFLSRSYYCTNCQKGYDHKEDHKCNNPCTACRKVHSENTDEKEQIYCEKCRRFFRGQTCFELHRQKTPKGNSTCQNIYRCAECGKTVNRKMSAKPHRCGDVFCENCRLL